MPKSIQQWEKQFLENASLVFEEAVPVKKYKEQVNEKDKQIEDLQKALGKATIERDWILKKVKSLGSINFTSNTNKEHKKYPYLLKEKGDVNKPNAVWASDITYIKLKNGFVYLCAIIDWNTRTILSHKLSNSIDAKLIVETLNDAISVYGKPDVFNVDQDFQYIRIQKVGLTIT
ncbi:MAG: hypothetical protein C0174_03970 [Thermodesulfobium narugense]|nr:MAG: hypothetical protein C0174_03970 [Thermodesulfobium narugense]